MLEETPQVARSPLSFLTGGRPSLAFLGRSDFLRDSAIVFGSTTVVNVVSYAIHFILSRKLGVIDYGAFASLISLLGIVGIPASIVTMIVVKFVAEFNAVGDRAKIGALAHRLLWPSLLAGVGAVAIGVLLRVPIAQYFRLSDSTDVLAAAMVLSFALVLPILRGILQGTQDFKRLAISTVLEAVAKVGLAVGLAYWGFGVPGVFAGYLIAGLLSVAYTYAAARRHWSNEIAALMIDARRLLQTTGAVILGTSAVAIMGFVDVPLIKHFFEPQAAGIYSAVSVCGKMLFFLVGFVPVLVLPKAAHRSAQGAASSGVLVQGIALMLAFGAVGLAVFYVVPNAVVRLTYGAAFVPAAPYIFTYGVAMTLLATTNVVMTYRIGLHRYGFVLPLIAIAIIEPVGLSIFHATLWSAIHVLLACNFIALVSCLIGVPLRAVRQAPLRPASERMP